MRELQKYMFNQYGKLLNDFSFPKSAPPNKHPHVTT